MRRGLLWWLTGAPLVVLLSCAGLVGIDDAKLDPESVRGGAPSATGGASSGGQNSASGGATGTPDGGQGGEGANPTVALCARYCEAVMANCTGPVQVYESLPVCLRACQVMDPGTPQDRMGNTIGCRLFHAKQIELIGEEATECPAAGPGGDGVCGTNCRGYCSLLEGLCPAQFNAECVSSCKDIPDLGGYNSMQMSGLTLQCRLYHVSAATLVPDFHCPHAAGAGPCSR
ncbi:MAG TPA: hypothetical protein VG937_09690 [Polyangiaceae bacterium]|nr:hypothetical protein [Polyangiaceae bacterium]